MNEVILELEKIRDQHDVSGKKLLALSDGNLFPCDLLYLSVLNRSLELYEGFILLEKNGNYGCCMALLRMQLDNILRFYGVLITKDQHDTAKRIHDGTQLNKMTDKKGKKLKDYYLLECLSEQNSWIKRIYKLCCSYIHLSDQHTFHMLERFGDEAEDGKRNFYINSDYEHVNKEHRVELIKAFNNTTQGIFKLLTEWEKLSKDYDPAELRKKYV